MANAICTKLKPYFLVREKGKDDNDDKIKNISIKATTYEQNCLISVLLDGHVIASLKEILFEGLADAPRLRFLLSQHMQIGTNRTDD